MASIKIWTVESDYKAEALKSLADRLTTNLKLDDLSIQTVGSKAFLLSNGSDESLNGELKKAIRYYLKQDDYVIFLADSKSSVSARPCPQKAGALIEQIKQVVVDPDFAGKVFFALGVQELEARLWRAHLGIEDPDRVKRMDSAETRFRQLCASRGLDWDTMTETERENFVDDLIHEDRECAR
jgi:hypothetical protein